MPCSLVGNRPRGVSPGNSILGAKRQGGVVHFYRDGTFDEAAFDDAAIDGFAAAMKAKMARNRAKGRSGWFGGTWSMEDQAKCLVEHLGKGNAGTFEDLGIYAMFLFARDADPMLVKNALTEAMENYAAVQNAPQAPAGELN